jgi:hypothetical protein
VSEALGIDTGGLRVCERLDGFGGEAGPLQDRVGSLKDVSVLSAAPCSAGTQDQFMLPIRYAAAICSATSETCGT